MSQLDDIKKTVDETLEGMQILLQWKAKLDERCKNHLEKIMNMHQELYSNPIGLVYRIQNLENCKQMISNGQKTKEQKEAEFRIWWMGILQHILKWGIVAFLGWLLLIYAEHYSQKKQNTNQASTANHNSGEINQ